MAKTPKTGLEALLRPEDSILVLIDHQPYQFTNLNSHEPTMIINNVIGLAKTAKVFNVPTILSTVVEERGGYLIKGLQDVFPQQKPRPATVALVSADAEFSRNPIFGAKANAKKYDFKIVHETTYPLTTKDFTPVIDAVAESNCDLLFLCSCLADSIGLVRTIHAHRFRPKMVGGGMIGPQNTAVKTTLGPLLNGFVNYEYWQPVPKMRFPGVEQFLNTYQARAGDAGVDLLGHYMAPLAYAQVQVVAQAVEATGGFDDARLAAYTRSTTFDTVMGSVTFGLNGEWAEPCVLQVQFQGISGHEVGQFQSGSRQIVVTPPNFASGEVSFPYAIALCPE